jgi:hypothetical protein
MKRFVGVVVTGVFLVAGAASAQQPAQPPNPAPGHQMPMQGGMCGLMGGGGMMGRGMIGGGMGMMGAQSDSPRMMQMRGEMMKAMGEVMMRYGKMMEGAAR